MFWETLPGLVASWAAALAGLIYLSKKLWKAATRSWVWLRRALDAIARLLEIGDENEWPNGSQTLPQAMREIYDRQGQTHELIRTHLGDSEAFWLHHLEEWHGNYGEEG